MKNDLTDKIYDDMYSYPLEKIERGIWGSAYDKIIFTVNEIIEYRLHDVFDDVWGVTHARDLVEHSIENKSHE